MSSPVESGPAAVPSVGHGEEDKTTKKRKVDEVDVKAEVGNGGSSTAPAPLPLIKTEAGDQQQLKVEQKLTLKERVASAYERVREFQVGRRRGQWLCSSEPRVRTCRRLLFSDRPDGWPWGRRWPLHMPLPTLCLQFDDPADSSTPGAAGQLPETTFLRRFAFDYEIQHWQAKVTEGRGLFAMFAQWVKSYPCSL